MGARFVRLGITGFKSFAEQASVEILPGLTGVVGPNGCGKSNVAEALRWVMGESNARSLRGGEMDDVIFAGTANRPSRNLAEVSLSVESDENGLPPPFAANAELQVVRRIERGGGSSYRINGREARSRDVQTLFADLASGARSTAMVSQGRVGTLVSAKPEERRGVLEEAAGITGLHARRAEAETRLRAAEANLDRAEEQRASLERQLERLGGQAKQAARYRTILQAVMDTEAAMLSLQRARAQDARRTAEATLAAARESIQSADAEQNARRAAATRAQAAVGPLREQEGGARAQLERAMLVEQSIAAEAARAEHALSAAAQRCRQIAADLVHAKAALADSTGSDERLAAETVRLEAESASHPAALGSAEAAALEAAATLASADSAANSAATELAEASARAGAVKHLLDEAETRLRRAREAVSRAKSEWERAAAEVVAPAAVDAADTALRQAETALTDARAALDTAEPVRIAAATAAASAREEYTLCDARRHKLAAETAALAEVLAVKDGEGWQPMVDRLQVPRGLEGALGAALGEELGAADDPAAPRHWRDLPPLPRTETLTAPLSESVHAPPVLARALRGVGLVQSDAEGHAGQAGLQPGQTLVSAAGGMWRWDGYTVRAGAPTAAAVRLRQRNRLQELRAELLGAEAACGTAWAARDLADQADRAAAAAEQEARAGRRAADAACDRARAQAQAVHSQARDAGQRFAALDHVLRQHAAEHSAAEGAAASARADAACQPDVAVLRSEAERARAAVAVARMRESTAQRLLDGLHRAEQGRQHRIVTIRRERTDRRERMGDLAERVTELTRRQVEAEAEHARCSVSPEDAARQCDQAAAARLQAETASRGATQARKDAEMAADALDGVARKAEQETFRAREEAARSEAGHEAALQAEMAVEQRIAEREGALHSLPEPGTDRTPAAEERIRNRLQRLSREREEMGPVNLRAELEAEAVGAEIATIERERQELETAIAKLRGSIGHLNREGRERLTEVFQTVDRHFQALFARMFGGGRAHIALVGSDDPLQAGLEIYAQPPGKKLAALSLLSGGEQALTALSLIFAVFRCNPAPLCVLDEVDAPLDDANVERFCVLLSDMVRETGTRFVVVTHNQQTMARMDRLYGVTMQERGVSRLLSVNLSGAQGMLEAVAAE